MSKGIGLSIFEFRGKTKKKLFEYRADPKDMDKGIDVLNMKFGYAIRKHSEQMSKRMRY